MPAADNMATTLMLPLSFIFRLSAPAIGIAQLVSVRGVESPVSSTVRMWSECLEPQGCMSQVKGYHGACVSVDM